MSRGESPVVRRDDGASRSVGVVVRAAYNDVSGGCFHFTDTTGNELAVWQSVRYNARHVARTAPRLRTPTLKRVGGATYSPHLNGITFFTAVVGTPLPISRADTSISSHPVS